MSAESADLPAEAPRASVSVLPEIDEENVDLGRWIGFIDDIDRTVIKGWCYDHKNPERRVPIEVVASNGRRAMTFASNFRQDVKDAGHGSGNYGFEIDVAGLVSKDDTLIVRFADSGVAISKAPFSLDPQRGLLDGRLPEAFTNAMRLRALDVKARFADLEKHCAATLHRNGGL